MLYRDTWHQQVLVHVCLILAVCANVLATEDPENLARYAGINSTLYIHLNHPNTGQDLKSSRDKGAVRPRIYIYDLPESQAKYRNWKEFPDMTDTNYALDQILLALLYDSPYITTDPDKADYFIPDVWLFHPNARPEVQDVIKEMRAAGPWFDRKGGSDHIFVITADQGRCEYLDRAKEAHRSIFIQHFGGTLVQDVGMFCDMNQRWGGDCDRERGWVKKISKGQARSARLCHHPGQDIVVPTAALERGTLVVTGKPFYYPGYIHPEHKLPYIHKELQGLNRSNKLYWAGVVNLDEHASRTPGYVPFNDCPYSFGGRQTVWRTWHRNSSLMSAYVGSRTPSYELDLSSHTFCLSTAGWGWSGRFKASVTHGCIPVVVQDGIRVEWEEQLPLGDLALRVPLWAVHRLPQLLQHYVDSGRVPRMQKVLSCAWRLFWWRRPYGRAFELLMCELKRRRLRQLGAAGDPGGGGPQRGPHNKRRRLEGVEGSGKGKARRLKDDAGSATQAGSATEEPMVHWDSCTLSCGDGERVDLVKGWNNV